MADSPVVIAQINELSNQINELYSGMEAITAYVRFVAWLLFFCY